jgi:type I restriction enzyme R subunit
MDKIKDDKPILAPVRVWQAYAFLDEVQGENPVSELTALIALIRRACGIDKTISRHSEIVRKNFQAWIMKRHSGEGKKFTKEQLEWLHMIRDHIISSFHIERDDLEANPFDTHGGMGKMFQLFGDDMDGLINDLNEALAA